VTRCAPVGFPMTLVSRAIRPFRVLWRGSPRCLTGA
jgi:hypothetical protein